MVKYCNFVGCKNDCFMINRFTPHSANESFQIRSYGKSELAQLYLPDITPEASRRTMKAWIHRSPGLEENLRKAGFTPTSHYYPPRQVALIVEALGEP